MDHKRIATPGGGVGTARFPMALALEAAHRAALLGEVPVGAVVTDASGAVLAVACNETERRRDPTAHAEMLALREAAARLGRSRLLECDLTVTLEPCPMCAQAISFFRLRRVVFGAYDPKGGGVEHGPRIFDTSSCFHRPEIIGGYQETACAAILQNFFLSRR